MRPAITRFGIAWLSVRLLAGLATTVLVAWSLVFVVDTTDGSNWFWHAVRLRRPDLGEGAGTVSATFVRAPGTRVYWGFAAPPLELPVQLGGDPDTLIPRWARRRVVPWLGAGGAPWPGAGEDGRMIVARGWPSLALFSEIRFGQPDRVLGGARLADWSARRNPGRVIPFYPRWTGIALDTVFYAVLWSMVPVGVRRIRRTLRRRAGVCPCCGYELRGVPARSPCPECGRSAEPEVSSARP